jgi:hypothetical protein
VFVSKLPPQRERSERPVGRLEDGTPIYAPIGEMLQDGDRVRCHLCGRWLRTVAGQHLIAAHQMTTEEYRELFHLDVSASTACADTSELTRASMLDQIAGAGPGRVYPLAREGQVAVSQLRSPLAPVPQGPQPGAWMPGLR